MPIDTTAYYIKKGLLSEALWYHLESNQGHQDFQSCALPTELWYQLNQPMAGRSKSAANLYYFRD